MHEVSHRQRMVVLAVCCMSLLIVSLDNTVLNVALPQMRHDLDAPVSGMQWTIDAYTLTMASLLMLAGSTADRIGRRKVFTAGLVLFTLGSLLCSLAPGLGWLIAFRAVQAVGAAMLNPVAMSIIANTFTDPAERARAIGIWGGVAGISMAAGPLIGGVLVDSVGWRSIFWVNLPIGLAALVLTLRYIPESRAPRPRRPDPLGQLLVMALLGSLTYGIIEAPTAGLRSGLVLGCAAVAVASFVGLLVHEPRCAEPLIDLRFFRSAPFSGATVIAISAFAGLAGFLFLTTLYLQDVRGLDALHAGLWMLPLALMTCLIAPLSGRLVGSRGPRLPLVVAGVGMGGSGLLFAAFGAERSDWLMLAAFLLFGVGFGMVNSPITNTAVSGMPRSQAGVAAAVAATSRQTGGTLGVAVIGSVLAAGLARGGEFTGAAHPAWWIITVCGALVLLLGALTTGRWALATAERAARAIEPAGGPGPEGGPGPGPGPGAGPGAEAAAPRG
ncbi:MFS transporter [Streptomyces sp. NPDC012888]|uniref:MFS transporter n=1 Tax=Streptomyces sp. NPDC012888 TaxID=3364855 RepID=UPI00367E589D